MGGELKFRHYLFLILLFCSLINVGYSQDSIEKKQNQIGWKILNRMSLCVGGTFYYYGDRYKGSSEAATSSSIDRLVGFQQVPVGGGYAIGIYGDCARYRFFILSLGIAFSSGEKKNVAIPDSVTLYNPNSTTNKYVDWNYDILLPIWFRFKAMTRLEFGFRIGIPLYSFSQIYRPEFDNSIWRSFGSAFEMKNMSTEISIGYTIDVPSGMVQVTPLLMFGGQLILERPAMQFSFGLRINLLKRT